MFSGANDVLGIQINNNYISLPGELFNGSGTYNNFNQQECSDARFLLYLVFVASFYFENIAHLFPSDENT